jgi:phage-related protein (TIGR01555 family)
MHGKGRAFLANVIGMVVPLIIANSRAEAVKLVEQKLSGNAVAGGMAPTERQLGSSTSTITGFPTEISKDEYEDMYSRTIGGNIVDKPANDTWREWFNLVTDDKGKEFEEEARKLDRKLSTQGNFTISDRLNRLDGNSIIYIGVKDNKNADEALEKGSLKSIDDVLFLKTYRESEYTVTREEDKSKDNFNQIISFTITNTSKVIHASRVLTMSENHLGDPYTNAIPALMRPYNYIQSLENVSWAGSEAAFKYVVPPWIVNFGDLGEPDDTTQTNLQAQLDDFRTSARQTLMVGGISIEPLVGAGNMVDTEKIINKLLELIAGASNMPQRMISGSAAGELSAASADLMDYYASISSRQHNFAEPVVRQYYSLLQFAGALPEAEYSISWNPLFKLTDGETAALWEQRARAADILNGRSLEPILPPEVIISEVLRLDPAVVAEKANMRGNESAEEKWARFFMNTDGLEDTHVKKLRRFFIRQGDEVSQDIIKGNIIKANAFEDIIDDMNKELTLIISDMNIEAAEFGALRALKDLGLEGSVDFGTTEAVIDRALKASKEIDNATKREITEQLAKGAAEGESRDAIARRINNIFEDSNLARSNRIAQTEINAASNKARADEYVKHGVEKHEWLTGGANIRDTHLANEADGPIPIGEAFSGNGLRWPGDYSGPPEEVINCKCTLAPVVEETEEL